MGNLLGAPITEKETHSGVTPDGLEYGISSMQGWRIHMEDAHITQGAMYAEEKKCPLQESSHPELQRSDSDKETKEDGGAVKRAKTTDKPGTGSCSNADSPITNGTDCEERQEYTKINLPGHSLFSVFDGHGGQFAAEYAGLNFVRVLARQNAFVKYAHFVNDLASRDALDAAEGDNGDDNGHKLTAQEKAQINRQGLELLETALRDAFLDIDREIWREVNGLGNKDAIVPGKKTNGEGGDQNENEDMQDDHNQEGWQKSDSGTTAVVVMITPTWIICANAGDSRSVYSKQGNCSIPLSYDHKPDDEAEERRVYEAGGFVRGGRVEGDLAVSRGLGDFRFKQDEMYQAMGTETVTFSQYDEVKAHKKSLIGPASVVTPEDQKVSPMPDIVVQNRNFESDEFVVVACDGIFDVVTNVECVAMAADIFREGEDDLGLVCEEILDCCLEKGSKDNMTALIVKMPAQRIGEGGGVEERRRLRLEAASRLEEEEASIMMQGSASLSHESA